MKHLKILKEKRDALDKKNSEKSRMKYIHNRLHSQFLSNPDYSSDEQDDAVTEMIGKAI